MGKESRDQCPRAVLAMFSTTRPEPPGVWEGARWKKEGSYFPTRDAQQLCTPQALWLLQLAVTSVNYPCYLALVSSKY